MASRAWCSVEKGDRVRVIAPGMPYNKQHFRRALDVLEGWGLDVEVPKGILGKALICANSREARAKQLKDAIRSEAKIIWCARGGYGSLHLLEALSKVKRPRTSKLLIGFSDITTLHQHVNQKWQWPSLHGPHIESLSAMNAVALKRMKNVLFGNVSDLTYKGLRPLNQEASKLKKLKAPIVGGNLITLQSTIGTTWQLNPKGKIIFLEDIGERAYKVDRVLEHMRYLGFWKQARAIIFGRFVGGEEPGGRRSKVLQLLSEFANSQSLPVYSNLAAGHIPNSLPIPLNTQCHLVTQSDRTTLKIDTGVRL